MLQARIRSKTDTTAHWNAATTFVPLKGEVIIYSDYGTEVINGETVDIPNFKVGDGMAYVPDLPFVADDIRQTLTAHILDTTAHLTAAERAFWNAKVRCYMNTETENGVTVENEELVFTTN